LFSRLHSRCTNRIVVCRSPSFITKEKAQERWNEPDERPHVLRSMYGPLRSSGIHEMTSTTSAGVRSGRMLYFEFWIYKVYIFTSLFQYTSRRNMLLRLFLSLFLFFIAGASNLSRRNSTGLTDEVTWDPHSLSIRGQRIFILSAEIHPWRLPGNPGLWADLFQKVKSNGFNTVCFIIDWTFHYPEPTTNNGNGDFEEGTYRDIQRFIDEAKKAGLWMIARCVPL